jgi:hypothetical protein
VNARDERGFTTVQYVAATAFSLLLLMLLANLLVDLYARGAVREALDEATRAAVPVDARPDACERRARDVLDGLLHGPVGDGVVVACSVGADRVHVHADVRLRSWLPRLAPAWEFTLDASARRAT